MRKILRVLHLLYREILSVLESPRGAMLFFHLLKRKQSTHYIIIDQFIGDSLAGLVYLRAYRKEKGYNHVTVIAPSYFGMLCDAYADDIDEVIWFSKRQIYELEMFAKTFWGQWILAEKGRNRITFVHWICYFSHRCIDYNSKITLKEYIRDFLYQLSADAEMVMPQFLNQDISHFIEKYELKEGKTVLLNPYANTVKENVLDMFSQLAEILRREGYSVKTITANEQQKAVPNTEAIPCSLAEAFNLTSYCGHLIGLRSGFMDLMLFSGCNLVSIEPPTFLEGPFFRLEGWEVNPRCHSILYDGNRSKTLEDVLEAILDKSV